MLEVLGLDIGGANLKVAHTRQAGRSLPFPLWRTPRKLSEALTQLIAGMPPYDLLAVTMTGELCDCFANKQEGVRSILTSVAEIAGHTPVRVWTTRGRFLPLEQALRETHCVAAANWLASALLAGSYAPEAAALFMDVGSTTTDIVQLGYGKPVTCGLDDVARLKSGELVYTGVRRTPVCALVQTGLAAELFATTLDAYLLLGMIPEDSDDCNTADGRPAAKEYAHARLARMLGGDGDLVSNAETLALAREVMDRQMARIRAGMEMVCGRMSRAPGVVVLAGSGEFLARAVVDKWGVPAISFADQLKPALSESIAAYAVARLAQQRYHEQ